MRYFTTPSVRDARKSVAWSLFFIFLLYFTAPAYAAFAKLEVYQNVIGASLDALPSWVYTYGQLGLMSVCGQAAVDPAAVTAACGAIADQGGLLRAQDLSINADVIVIATPEIAGLPYVIAGLVAAGGLAAALSTADGLLLAIANALSHDVYYKMVDPDAPARRRLVVARVLLVVVALAAAATASTRPAGILAMVAWAFSLAAGGLFPALVLGVWSKRMNGAGAVAGIAVGFLLTLFYLVVTRHYPAMGVSSFGMTSLHNPVTGAPVIDVAAARADAATADAALASKVGWFNVNNISSALFGLPAGFLVMWLVSRVTPAPSKEMQEFIDEVRKPRGGTIMQEKTS
jgi:cation/acetate symporter